MKGENSGKLTAEEQERALNEADGFEKFLGLSDNFALFSTSILIAIRFNAELSSRDHVHCVTTRKSAIAKWKQIQ